MPRNTAPAARKIQHLQSIGIDDNYPVPRLVIRNAGRLVGIEFTFFLPEMMVIYKPSRRQDLSFKTSVALTDNIAFGLIQRESQGFLPVGDENLPDCDFGRFDYRRTSIASEKNVHPEFPEQPCVIESP